MKASISKRAGRSIERIAARWNEHADYPGVFMRELLDAIDTLENARSPGAAVPTRKHPTLKRLLLKKSHCHVYFKVDEPKDVVRILEVWDGRRGRSPKL